MTAAQRRSAEVRERTGGRRTSGEMSAPPDRDVTQWIDEGPTRASAPASGKSRTVAKTRRGGARGVKPLDTVVEEFEKALGRSGATKAVKRYEVALQAFEAQRYKEAQRTLVPMAKEYSDVFAVREMLGLCLYRGGEWKKALVELEAAQRLNPTWIFNHAVIADCHRALGNHEQVRRYWEELAAASPHPELLAEGRIVMAGSLIDQGDLEGAMTTMAKAAGDTKSPEEYHLRQWFVIGDLHDKMGNTIMARRFFERIAKVDRAFVDVAERLSALGGD